LEPLRLCVNTQTPLVQFAPIATGEGGKPSQRTLLDVSQLVEGRDYRFSPGGVTRMVFPLLKQMMSRGVLKDAHWVALNPDAPERARIGGIELFHVSVGKDVMQGYGKTKETMWKTIHGVQDSEDAAEDLFWRDEYSDFAYYNRFSAELIAKLDRKHEYDVFYIHDFQQLPVGHMLKTLKPKVFRWHIPFDESMIPTDWKGLLSTYFNSYDVVVVSSKKYLRSLKSFGYSGRVVHVYPYVDPSTYTEPSKEQVDRLCSRFGITPGDELALVVARMDPMKGQDRAIKALAALKDHHPRLKLMLVGDGSFSSSREGLGLSKGDRWKSHLETIAAQAEVRDRVIFTGHLSQVDLDAAYARCALTILPSVREGFGLVVIESWLHKKPAIVTNRAGISELVTDGRNGFLFDPNDVDSLAKVVSRVLNHDSLRSEMGEKGFSTSKLCHLERGVKAESELLLGLV